MRKVDKVYKVDVRKISKNKGIPKDIIRKICCLYEKISILDEKLDKAKTVEEIEGVYLLATKHPEIKEKATKKWLTVFAKKSSNARTIQEIKKICKIITEGSKPKRIPR